LIITFGFRNNSPPERPPKWNLITNIMKEIKEDYRKKMGASASQAQSNGSRPTSNKGRALLLVKDGLALAQMRDLLVRGAASLCDQRYRWFVSQQVADIRSRIDKQEQQLRQRQQKQRGVGGGGGGGGGAAQAAAGASDMSEAGRKTGAAAVLAEAEKVVGKRSNQSVDSTDAGSHDHRKKQRGSHGAASNNGNQGEFVVLCSVFLQDLIIFCV
jgi:hypothetical protein